MAVIFNKGITTFYLDGQYDGSANNEAEHFVTNNLNLYIGKAHIGCNGLCGIQEFFNGSIDEIRIYNRALTVYEVEKLYNNSINIVEGKVVTSSEILGYTACVGGATVTALPYAQTSVTNIYGEYKILDIPAGECILQVESNYFKTLTMTTNIENDQKIIETIELYRPKCNAIYTQAELDQFISQIESNKNQIIAEKEKTIKQMQETISKMYTSEQLNEEIVIAEKRGELKYDINGDGKVGLEEIIKYLETISGVRLESLIIFPEKRKYYLNE